MALESPVQPPPRLAAQHSNEQTHVFFLNTTQRQVNVYWMDFSGSQDLFTTLPPGAGKKANTFVTHPWLFRDARTGERMHVKHQDIFWPQLYRVKNAGQWLPCRKLIAIHPPVTQSLRTRCLWRFSELIYGLLAWAGGNKKLIDQTLDAIEEYLNLNNAEQKTIHQRLKNMEDRILFLESISPEYYHNLFDKSQNKFSINENISVSPTDMYNTTNGSSIKPTSANAKKVCRKVYAVDDIDRIIEAESQHI